MGLFDRLVGTSRPEGDTPAQPESTVRAALLAVGADKAPYSVTEEEDGDLSAAWRIEEPAWRTYFMERNVSRSLEVTMRLREEDHQVRHVTEEKTVVREKGALRLAASAEDKRGNVRTVSKRWTIGGEEGVEETFSFDSAELTRALEAVAPEHGWTWKGVVGRL